MMYIDTTSTPLEDNDQALVYTRRKAEQLHIPTPSASAVTNVLLATRFADDDAEEPATHLLLAQGEEDKREREKKKIHISTAEIYRIGTCKASGDDATTTTIKDNEDKIAHFPTGIAGNAVNLKTAQDERKDEEEAIEQEHYELVDVFDTDQEEEQTPNPKQPRAEPPEIVIQFEEATEEEKTDDAFEYIVTRVQSKKSLLDRPQSPINCPANPLSIDRNSLSTANWSSFGQQKQNTRNRTRRSVPDAIPIRVYSSSVSDAAAEDFHQSKSAGPPPARHRLLNGCLPIFKRRNSQTSSNGSSSSSCSGNSARFSEPTQHRPVFRVNQEEEAAAEWFEENHGQDSQMGIDIFNKLKRLLNSNFGSNYDTHDGKRKRRSEDRPADALNPHQIKYRKVENRFPKYITHTLDDDLEISFPLKHHELKKLNLKKPTYPTKGSMDMTQRRSLHPIEKPKLRKSIFEVPQTSHKLIKNTTFAEIEFSDDDEPELVKGFGIGPGGGGIIKKSPKLYNIPISHRAENRVVCSSQKPPPPPLIEARTGGILASSLVPELDAIRKPTYADALRQNTASAIAGGGHVLGGGGVIGRAVSSMSSSGASTSASAQGYNWLRNIRANAWSTNARSILAQEKESDDRDKYQQLLEQVVPRLYGAENGAPHLSKDRAASAHHNEGIVARRRNALLVAAAAAGANSRQSHRHSPVGNRRSVHNDSAVLKSRPPLSSTINLNDDDDEDDDDVTLIGGTRLGGVTASSMAAPVVIDDDDEISDIIDLGDDERNVVSTCAKLRQEQTEASARYGLDAKKKKSYNDQTLPYVEPINTLQERFDTSIHLNEKWMENWKQKCNQRKHACSLNIIETAKVAEKSAAERRAAEVELHERLRKFQIVDRDILVIDDFPEPIIDEEPEFIELTADHQARIKAAICGSPDQVLVSKFNLNITRRDIHTLLGHNWLNDEVINFYMNLLTERGEKQRESGGRLPSVYAMNTFFVPRLMQAGHGGVKRWTRKVDIFAKDILPVPVHVGGVHWCMAIIHMRNRTIKYYDSMGTPNPSVLKALEQYLKDESMDKRKQPFDTSRFEIESVRDVPRQMNGSDCGVFSCMFAEYITRNREITFSQQNMEYFRHKMVLEIVRGELLH